MDVLKRIEEIGVVPVVTLHSVDETVPTIQTLVEGDIRVAEICFRTECAEDCIKVAVAKFPDVLIGAGTVINKEQCIKAIGCGVKFIVSPGFSQEVCDLCKEKNVPYLPGVVTPTEIMTAISSGLHMLKFFPAGVYGGLKAIKALGSAFPSCKFMPTGGVDNSNLAEFISCPKIIACGGSWLLKGSKEERIASCLEARKIIKENR